jgi:hypothetical protein
MPRHIRDYLAQPHCVYVDVFADGSVKVGTVAQARLHSRLAEQGAFAALYIASAEDGMEARRAEDAVTTALSLRQAVPSSRKLRALEAPVDRPDLLRKLKTAAEEVSVFLNAWSDSNRSLTVFGEPRPWPLPDCARAAFDRAPIASYPEDLSTGEHSMFLVAMTGTIAVFAVADEPGAPLYAANLQGLRGCQIELGRFQSQVRAVQTSLF